MVEIDLSELFNDQAKLSDLKKYTRKALAMAGQGKEVVITGPAPVWLYLKIGHALHGKAKRLIYRSPVTGDIEVFNHDPF